MTDPTPVASDPRLHTRFCDLVGVRHPIVQTGMGWVAGSRLTAATARAGGLGIIAAAPMTFDQMVTAIDEVRAATDQPFGVNLRSDAGDIDRRVEHLVTAEVRVASFAQAPDRRIVDTLKAAGVVAAIVVVGLVLALVPWDYRVEATGQLMPVAQQDVFAPNNGKVIAVLVKEGDRVERGVTVLVVLENLELNAQIETALSERENNRELLATLRAQFDRAIEAGNDPDAIELTGRIREAEILGEGLKKRLVILGKQKAELTVTAMTDGVVATFQVEQKLLNRPVNRGERLLEVMQVGGASKWRLELQVEEHRIGHILRHQEERLRLKVADPNGVPVEFVLATASEETYTGRLSRISTRADASQAGGSVVELHVEPTGETLPEHRIGAEVNARIHCGQRSLFYVLFGDVVEFVRKRLWL